MTGRFPAAALVLLTVSSLWAAAPASAVEGLEVTVHRPAADTVSASPVTVSGEVRVTLLGGDIDSVKITLVPEAQGGSPTEPVFVCTACGRVEPQRPVPFSGRVRASATGRYRVKVEASGRGVLGEPRSGTGFSGTFRVKAPPARPTDVKAEVSPERIVTVSWARNNEPDLLHYTVNRKNMADGSSAPVGGKVAQPASGRVSFVDPVPALVGGDFSYDVFAVAPGPTPGSPPLTSLPGTSDKVAVAAPPGGAAGSGAGGPGAGFAGFPPAQPNSTAASRPRFAEAPDTGFSESLPFGARPPGEQLEEGEEAAEPRTLDVGTTTTTSEFVARGRPLVPVAAGAILLLLALHLRLLNSRAKATPAAVSGPAHTDLAPLGFPPLDLAPVAEPPAPEPSFHPPPRAALFDYEEQERFSPVDDDKWAADEWGDEEIREVVVSRGR